MKKLKSYILDLLARGQFFFSTENALGDLGITHEQFRFQAYRLIKKASIKRLSRNFFMIISPEYRNLGSLPPLWLVNALMKHLNQEYYVGLLSAASLYDATEQQPMVFQVITTKTTKEIVLSRMTIEFHVFKYLSQSLVINHEISTGYVRISSREQTTIDLVRFYKVSGHLSNVASVIQNLAGECDFNNFALVVGAEQTEPVLQRLGYILECTKHTRLAHIVEAELARRKINYVFLRPDFYEKEGEKSERWKLIINDTL